MTKLHMTNLARMDMHIDAERLQELRKRYRAGRPMRYIVRPLLMAIMLGILTYDGNILIIKKNRKNR